MFSNSTLALATIGALGLADIAPDAALARGLGGGSNARISSSIIRGGFQTATSNAGRGMVPVTSQNNSNRFAGTALVTEVAVPKLDAASKDAAYFTVQFAQPYQHIPLQNEGCRVCAAIRSR